VHATKPADIIDVQEFIGVKGYKAKGKRVTTYVVEKLRFIPKHFASDVEVAEPEEESGAEQSPEEQISEGVRSIAVEPRVEESRAAESEPQTTAEVEEPREEPKTVSEVVEPKAVSEVAEPEEVIAEPQEEEAVPVMGVLDILEPDEPMPAPKTPRRRTTPKPAPKQEPVIDEEMDEVELEIIVPQDEDEVGRHIDSQQLNLF
jgi:hypothetical protein